MIFKLVVKLILPERVLFSFFKYKPFNLLPYFDVHAFIFAAFLMLFGKMLKADIYFGFEDIPYLNSP